MYIMACFDAKGLMSPGSYGLDEKTVAVTERTNLRIDLAWWDRWMGNFKRNKDEIDSSPALSSLYGGWTGEGCVVAGAGPSLAENLGALRAAKDAGWRVVAVDRAFGVLKSAGIRPDITVTCDAGENVAGFFRDGLVDGEDVFAVCVISHPAVFEKLRGGKVYVFGCANPFSGFWRFAEGRCREGVMCLRPGYVVTFSAVDLALWMGADRVVTAGNELSWRGEGEVDNCYRGAELVRLLDGRVTIGAFMRASRAFRFFPKRHPEVCFMDASGGIAEGWEPVDLASVVKVESAGIERGGECLKGVRV